MLQETLEALTWTEQFFRAFATGLLGVLGIYLVMFAILGILALGARLAGIDSVVRTFRVYQGYGAVLFALVPQVVLLMILTFGCLQTLDSYETSMAPQPQFVSVFNHDADRKIDWPGNVLSVFLTDYSTLEKSQAVRLAEGMLPVALQVFLWVAYAVAGAGAIGLISIFLGHFRRLMHLPLSKNAKPKEYAEPIVAMLLYLPSGGLLLMLSMGVLIAFQSAFIFGLASQLHRQIECLAASSSNAFQVSFYLFGGLASAVEVAFLFGLLLTLFTLVFALSLKRTFDSWLSSWYTIGDRLIDRPPPMLSYLKSSGRAAGKLLGVWIGCWGLTRLVLAGVGSVMAGTAVVLIVQLVMLNLALFYFGFYRELFRLFAALTDVWSLNKLYVWTTRTLIVPIDKVKAKL